MCVYAFNCWTAAQGWLKEVGRRGECKGLDHTTTQVEMNECAVGEQQAHEEKEH